MLLLVVVGVPWRSSRSAASPACRRRCRRATQLTGTLGTAQLLSVLVWVVWLAWLQFTICVVVELRSALRGVGLPARVPLAGSEPAARPHARRRRPAAGHRRRPGIGGRRRRPCCENFAVADAVTSTAVAGEVRGRRGRPCSARGRPAAAGRETTYQLGGIELSPEQGAELVGKRVYVVHPPEGRYHDNLWDIAERTMGDGRRYQEIFELNKVRDQPDGQELSLARLIYPNWLLVMPEDAVGRGPGRRRR